MKKTFLTVALITASLGSAFAADSGVAEKNFKATDPIVTGNGKYYLSGNDGMELLANENYVTETSQKVRQGTWNKLFGRVAIQGSTQNRLRSGLVGELRTVYKNLDNPGKIKRIEYHLELNDLTLACHTDIPEMNDTASCDAISGALEDIKTINLKIDRKQKIEKSDFAHATFDMPFEVPNITYVK